ncbi:DUF5305 domain-containing protein [Haloarcula salinisoli]|uniref:DUF5305 domain-containing protein n=1 Tax=Haloarcula salinisoli TaxID=2487746 RepID=A0A8J7YLV3_9EURY|nr:DUF5305 domain-containing protein [Halomicroarcula salinisoli]MBX0287273.1 DUF5305 domain-containing protein [Halomicroarcula salinisoli]MBX0305164.1 DUF5305 domain-containing protein [Halomicroarcula salinisoli]
MGNWYWRAKVAIADNYSALVVVAVLVCALGGYLTFTAAGSGATETAVRETDSWQSSGEFTHRATVVNGTAAFERGAVLRNRSVYFLRVTPILDGTFVYGFGATGSGDLDVNTSVALRYQSVSPANEGNQTVYWRVERPLNRSTATLSPGERTRTPFSVNVSAAAAEAERIDAQLGGTPGDVEVTVLARVRIDGTRNGQQVRTTRVYRTRLVPSDGTYEVRNDEPRTESGHQTVRRTVPDGSDSLGSTAGPALLVVGLAGMGGLGLFRRSEHFTVTDAQRELSSYEREREEFDEWITAGRLPESTFEDSRIKVDSLAGLVDVAIDSERRVIEDTERDVYVVLADGYRYIYYPPKGASLVDDGESGDTERGRPPSMDGTDDGAGGGPL